jgi:hypothetical protein
MSSDGKWWVNEKKKEFLENDINPQLRLPLKKFIDLAVHEKAKKIIVDTVKPLDIIIFTTNLKKNYRLAHLAENVGEMTSEEEEALEMRAGEKLLIERIENGLDLDLWRKLLKSLWDNDDKEKKYFYSVFNGYLKDKWPRKDVPEIGRNEGGLLTNKRQSNFNGTLAGWYWVINRYAGLKNFSREDALIIVNKLFSKPEDKLHKDWAILKIIQYGRKGTVDDIWGKLTTYEQNHHTFMCFTNANS